MDVLESLGPDILGQIIVKPLNHTNKVQTGKTHRSDPLGSPQQRLYVD